MTKLTAEAVSRLTQAGRTAAGLGLGVCLALASGRSWAERWSATASVDGKVTATDNVNFDTGSEKKGDVIFEVAPRVSILGEGARLRLNASAGLSAFTYTKGTQDSQLVPTAAASLWLEAIERTFFIESNVNVARTVDNPFGPQAPSASNVNTQDTYQARISPYFAGILGSRFRYLLRHDSAWTRSSGGQTSIGNQYASHEAAELALLPRPFGASLRFDRDESNRIEGTEGRSRSEIARATFSLSPDPQFTIGVRAGHERNNFPGFSSDRNFVGAELTWRPTERTNLAVVGENRFFGNGWTATFDHRMPRLAWSVRSSRDVSTSAQRFLGLPVTLDVAALIDASLTTRIPDPIERARAVEDLIVSRGLPRTLITPIDLFDERIEIQTINTATVSLLGARNTIALTLFSTSTEGLDSQAIGGVPPTTSLLDNRQRGVGLSFSHQLSHRSTLNAESSWHQTRGIGSSTGEQSRQQVYQLRLTHLLSPKTSTTAGMRYQVFDSTLQQDTTEKAVFLGIGHRF
jgi:uncharacterized protein (PEP-CTERM system associated)